MIGSGVEAFKDLVVGGDVANSTFRAMVESLPVAIYTTDAQGRLTYFNAAAVRLSGRVPEIGSDKWCVTWKLYLPDGTPLAHDECPMAIALRGGQVPGGIECIAERPDMTRFWFTPCPAILRDDEGKIIGGINLLVDITDRKAVETEAKEYYRTIIETTPECVKVVAPDGTLLQMNSAGVAMVGATSVGQVEGKNVYDLIAPEDRDRFREFNERICRGEKGSLEFDTIGLTGQRCHMETHAAPLQHSDGEIVQLAVTRDITERKRVERAALLLGEIVNSSDDAIISKDLNGVITSWNLGAERLFGYTPEEVIGQNVTILIPADRLDEETEILSRLKRGEAVNHFETLRRRKDGMLLDISLRISPVTDGQGKVIGVSKIARDITERKRADVALRRANLDLEQFAFSASHDLQEPLRSVKIYSELLANTCSERLDDQALEFLKYLRDGATRMEILVRDLLTYTQVTRVETPIEMVDASEALATTLANLAGAVSESCARITAGPLPVLRVHGAHLQQLFQNLIGNAIKYRCPSRPPVVHVTAECGNGYWDFAVSDNGIGIDPEHKERIFGLFKRLHTNREYSGTGIGLAICQRIVERYQGRIWVESEPGRGSTFRFTIPA
jgi:PAS domain S-box-containing protein